MNDTNETYEDLNQERKQLLRTICDPFDFETMNAKDAEKELIEICQYQNGLGLAANQVGINSRYFVMVNEDMVNFDKAFGVFNPEILEYSEKKVVRLEGCLSFPGVYLNKQRSSWIRAKFFTSDNNEVEVLLTNMLAGIFQHEYEHLNGITFIDGVSRLQLERSKKRVNKILKKNSMENR